MNSRILNFFFISLFTLGFSLNCLYALEHSEDLDKKIEYYNSSKYILEKGLSDNKKIAKGRLALILKSMAAFENAQLKKLLKDKPWQKIDKRAEFFAMRRWLDSISPLEETFQKENP